MTGAVRLLETPIGGVVLQVRFGCLASIAMEDGNGWRPPAAVEGTPADARVAALAAEQLEAYFAGRLTRFDLPLAPPATRFAGALRAAMMAIPYGGTARYGDLAHHVDSSPRAVGRGCGANPLPIVVPCHRVVAAAGLGGYSGGRGLASKSALLALEARHSDPVPH